MSYQVRARSIEALPGADRLRELAEKMPAATVTEFGNVNVTTRVDARSKGSTYVVTDDPSSVSDQSMPREQAARLAARQESYLAEQDVLVVDGYLGSDPSFRIRARLVIEAANANIAGMQQQLFYPLDPGDALFPDAEPVTTVVYTPNLPVPGAPDDRAILVDLGANVTRVMGSDYFGESKKGGLRMWNNIVFDRGGLALHAGCKQIPVARDGATTNLTVIIVGLSGTGKTTTTFTSQLGSRPVQDDFIALMPGGLVYTSENGCFAKTFGLDPAHEPVIYRATTQPDAYLENVCVDALGNVDFFDTGHTKNGRTTWPFSHVAPADPATLAPAEVMLILNRDDSIVPGVARLDRAQAAAYFMLGETQGTSAGGKAEEGRRLRIPGTNPFFPRRHAEMGNRFLELLDSHELSVYVLNTGRIGGAPTDERSKKVEIAHSSAFVQGIAEGTISWEQDPDFGYLTATSVPGIDDAELLAPRRLYERQGRSAEYAELVRRRKSERSAYLASFPGLAATIAHSV